MLNYPLKNIIIEKPLENLHVGKNSLLSQLSPSSATSPAVNAKGSATSPLLLSPLSLSMECRVTTHTTGRDLEVVVEHRVVIERHQAAVDELLLTSGGEVGREVFGVLAFAVLLTVKIRKH